MKALQNTLFSASFTLLLSACASTSSVDWTTGTWTEGEYAAGHNDDECGIVTILNALETPLQYKLGPKTERWDTGRYDTYDTGGSESLSEDAIASISNNLWEGCDEPDGYASFYCDFTVHELHQTKWIPAVKEQFCPESTEISFLSGYSYGLVINENEIFFQHYVDLRCVPEIAELDCSSRYVSRLRPSGSD